MTLQEAATIFEIVSTVDGDCESCATSLFDSLSEAFLLEYKLTKGWYDDDCKIQVRHKGFDTPMIEFPSPWAK